MGRKPAKTMKGSKRGVFSRWDKRKPQAHGKAGKTVPKSICGLASDPVTQCAALLVIVSMICFLLKSRRRKRGKAASSVLSSKPVGFEEMCHQHNYSHNVETSSNRDPTGLVKHPTNKSTIGPSRMSEHVESEGADVFHSLASRSEGIENVLTFEGGPIDHENVTVTSEQQVGENSMSEDSSCHQSRSSTSYGSYHTRRLDRSNSPGSIFTCDSSKGGESSLASWNDGPSYLTIYYASQSGTSAYYSLQLQREGVEMGFDTALRSVRSVTEHMKDVSSPEKELRRIMIPHVTRHGKHRGRAAFLVSTYHEGGPTDDAKAFVDLLQSLKNTDCLRGLRFSVYGFGDSAYGKTFNTQAKLYDQLLEHLGAKRFTSIGLGDRSKDQEYDFELFKWRKFWPRLADLSSRDSKKHRRMSGDETGEPTVEGEKEEKKRRSRLRKEQSFVSAADTDGGFVLKIHDASTEILLPHKSIGMIHASARHLVRGVECRVQGVKQLWNAMNVLPYGTKPCSAILVEIDLTPSPVDDGIPPFRYETGDNICVLPVNKISIVEDLAKHLEYSLDTTFTLAPKDEDDLAGFEPLFPTPCTVRDYLSFYCELSMPPCRSIIRALSRYATVESERDELIQISSVLSYQEFKSRIMYENIGLADLITRHYTSIRIPLGHFIRLCAPLQARWYSISSSSLVNPNKLSITCSVISIPRKLDDSVYHGVCSHYLASLNPATNDTVRIIRMGLSGFVAPQDPSTPLIMICNGTGISPFRAIMEEIDYKKMVLKHNIGTIVLFFGIRRQDHDFLYKQDLEIFLENGSLTHLHLACSREEGEKLYVQDLVARHIEMVWTMLQSGAHIYACGATAMTNDIDTLLRNVASRFLGPVEANAFIAEMEVKNRYVREGWTSLSE